MAQMQLTLKIKTLVTIQRCHYFFSVSKTLKVLKTRREDNVIQNRYFQLCFVFNIFVFWSLALNVFFPNTT